MMLVVVGRVMVVMASLVNIVVIDDGDNGGDGEGNGNRDNDNGC